MAKYEYAYRNVFCKSQEDVDRVLNEEVYKMNKPEDVVSLQVVPYINPQATDGMVIPCCWYICYVYRWEIDED